MPQLRIGFAIMVLVVSCLFGCKKPAAEPPTDAPSAANEDGAEAATPAPAAGPVIECREAWARPGRGAARTGAMFVKIANTGDEADRLVSAASTVAEVVELHESYKDGEVMRMRRIDGVDIPAGGELELKPGGLHIMLIGMKEDLDPGAPFSVDLTFEKSEPQTLVVEPRTE